MQKQCSSRQSHHHFREQEIPLPRPKEINFTDKGVARTNYNKQKRIGWRKVKNHIFMTKTIYKGSAKVSKEGQTKNRNSRLDWKTKKSSTKRTANDDVHPKGRRKNGGWRSGENSSGDQWERIEFTGKESEQYTLRKNGSARGVYCEES